MDVGFKYRGSGKLPKVKVPGTFYYLAKSEDKDEQLWFCFSDTLIKRVDNELLNADEVNAVIKEYLEKNGISLDGYATEKWVEDKDYAIKTDIPTKLSKLDNDSGYINQIKTINGEELTGEGNIEILGEVTQAKLDETLKYYVKKEDEVKKSVWEELPLSD